jgi:dihydroorotase
MESIKEVDMNQILIVNSTIVNEGQQFVANVLIEDGIIKEIGFPLANTDATIIDAKGMYLLPGIIDAHVHFREPGLSGKGDIFTESRAAVAGGITSYMDMPNTIPNTTNINLLDQKFNIAGSNSFANYSFYIGIKDDNLGELLNVDFSRVCGITDDGLYFTKMKSMLVDQPELMKEVLSRSPKLVAIHSEIEAIIQENLRSAINEFGQEINIKLHPKIRSEEACYLATQSALKAARETGGRLHVLHLSTVKEAMLFDNTVPLQEKKITAEVCVHHLWFSDEDYIKLGAKIKWNPAIKTGNDKEGLLAALIHDHIDIVSTDHAPHLLEEKQRDYLHSPGGAPMVQHSLVVMLEFVQQGKISIEKIVEKMCHNPAILFGIEKRGFIRTGYNADIVIVDLNDPWVVSKSNIYYKCGWSPLEGYKFSSKVFCTIVNGKIAFKNGGFSTEPNGKCLRFNQ